VIVTLPLDPALEVANATPRTAHLRYSGASLPEGPFLDPAATASCSWSGFDVPELPRIPEPVRLGARDTERALGLWLTDDLAPVPI
jgi:hypothetical protein